LLPRQPGIHTAHILVGRAAPDLGWTRSGLTKHGAKRKAFGLLKREAPTPCPRTNPWEVCTSCDLQRLPMRGARQLRPVGRATHHILSSAITRDLRDAVARLVDGDAAQVAADQLVEVIVHVAVADGAAIPRPSHLETVGSIPTAPSQRCNCMHLGTHAACTSGRKMWRSAHQFTPCQACSSRNGARQ
jgi:hypothetical protein